jgi:alpha-L-arabinofuranosidase
MPKLLLQRIALAWFGLMPLAAYAGLFEGEIPHGACPDNAFVARSDAYGIDVDSARLQRRLQGSFFGFNVEWVEFQRSFWDSASGRVRSDLIEALRPFAGAVYRYPGGGIANHTDWSEGELPREQRRKVVREGWTPPMALEFGVQEYLDFVAEVGGNAWYVANLYGRESGELPAASMAAEAGALARKLAALRVAGKPPILRWELGNEMDRGVFLWPADKLASVANSVAQAVRKADPQAKFLVVQQEYPTLYKQGISQSEYNRALAKAVRSSVDEYAAHIYYDDGGSALSLPKMLSTMCLAIADARAARPDLKISPFWITETARVPEGIYEKNGKRVWPQTGNLQSAISVADFYISAAQIPEVQGAFLHALHGTDGPWPMFHASRDNSRLSASVVFLAATILRESMLPLVLNTKTSSRNQGSYNGGYDLHAVVMTDEFRQNYSMWAINRSGVETVTSLRIPALRQQTLSARLTVLADAQLMANNMASAERLRPRSETLALNFDAEGKTFIRVPPQAVYTLQLQTTNAR